MSGLPRTAKSIKKLAEDNGWSVLILENEPDQGEVKVHTTLLLSREGHEVAAFWHDGLYDGARVQFPPLPLLQRDLKDLLSTPAEEFGFDKWPPDLKDDPKENLKGEYEMCGFYISGHPLDHVNMGQYPDVVQVTDVEQFSPGQNIQVLGVVEEPEVVKSRRGYWLAFFGVSDLSGLAPCFGFGEDYKEMKAGMLVHVKGVIEERDGQRQIKARTVREIEW